MTHKQRKLSAQTGCVRHTGRTGTLGSPQETSCLFVIETWSGNSCLKICVSLFYLVGMHHVIFSYKCMPSPPRFSRVVYFKKSLVNARGGKIGDICFYDLFARSRARNGRGRARNRARNRARSGRGRARTGEDGQGRARTGGAGEGGRGRAREGEDEGEGGPGARTSVICKETSKEWAMTGEEAGKARRSGKRTRTRAKQGRKGAIAWGHERWWTRRER